MFSLSPRDILAIWERGERQHAVERGLIMLAWACPCVTPDQLASFSLGMRDSLLLRIREETLGTAIKAFAVCPSCSEKLEFSFSSTDFGPCLDAAAVSLPAPQELVCEDFRLRFHPPSSNDLMAIPGDCTPEQARARLIDRCVIELSRHGDPIAANELPEEVIQQLADRMTELDPRAEITLDLSCPACRHTWQTIFDIASFLYEEISVAARRLLEDVHSLALAYGWSEKDILSMTDVRRQFYLSRVRE